MLVAPTLYYGGGSGTSYYNDHGSIVTYYSPSGSWTYSGTSFTGDYDNDETWNEQHGATATITFTGTSIEWIGPYASNHGYANVILDNSTVATNIDTYSPVTLLQRVIWNSGPLPYGTHTLEIYVDGTNDGHSGGSSYVSMDLFQVGDSAGAVSTPVTTSPLPYSVKTYDSCGTPVTRTVPAPIASTTSGSSTVYPVAAPYGTSLQVCFANSATNTNTGEIPSSGPQLSNTNLNGTTVTPLSSRLPREPREPVRSSLQPGACP